MSHIDEACHIEPCHEGMSRVPYKCVMSRTNEAHHDSEDDTAHPQQLLSFVGAAQAPSGYKILESCPSLETDQNIQNHIGTRILHAWDDKDRQG